MQRRKHRIVVEVTFEEPCTERRAIYQTQEVMVSAMVDKPHVFTKVLSKSFRRVTNALGLYCE